jgi:hypothetical protein
VKRPSHFDSCWYGVVLGQSSAPNASGESAAESL